jgi:hypothetical protein
MMQGDTVTIALDILSTFGVAVMLHGVLRPSAANWREGGLGAAANIVAAISLSWPIARIWASSLGAPL